MNGATYRRFFKMVLSPIAVAEAAAVLKGAVATCARRKSAAAVRSVHAGVRCIPPSPDHTGGAALAALPDFGRPLADVVTALDVPEPRVIDIGANIGDTVLLLARFAP